MAPNHFRRDPPHQGGGLRKKVTGPPLKSTAKPQPEPAPESSTFTRVALLTILLSSLMVYGAPRLGPVWSRMVETRLAAREMAELESLETYRLTAKFDEWLAREDLGLAWIVGALGSEQTGVSYHAEQALLRELDSWRVRDQQRTTQRMLQLAHALNQHVQQIPAPRRPAVRRLIERMATWPVSDAKLASELVAACDSILARLPPAEAEELLLAEREAADDRMARALDRRLPVVQPAPVLEELKAPLEIAPVPDLPPRENSDEDKPSERGKKVPKRFFAPRAQELPGMVQGPSDAADAPIVSAVPKRNLNDWVRDLADLEVMRLLHHGDYGVRYTAERELDRRGYATEHLPLAKLLVHPDPRERRKLAEQLPRMTNVDPRPWLLQLSEDDDAGVRRAADGILQATRPGLETRK